MASEARAERSAACARATKPSTPPHWDGWARISPVLGPVGVVQRRQEQHAGIIYERAAKRGEQIDASAPAIYPTHVDKISEALMKEGSDHTAIVNITQLTTLYSGARPCEPENLALRGM